MSKKKFMIAISLVIFLISALSVFSIVKDVNSPKSRVRKFEFKSDPQTSKADIGIECSAQSGTRPPAWTMENKKLRIKK